MERLADKLIVQVEKTLSRTGAKNVHLVGHSLGGVIIAQAALDRRLNGRVDTVITLGSPFGGSPWAGALPVIEIVRALRAGSPLLRRLASTPLPDGVRWLSVAANLDVIVPGLRSVPFHPQVETITVNASATSDAPEQAGNRMHHCRIVRRQHRHRRRTRAAAVANRRLMR